MMKINKTTWAALALAVTSFTSCIEEIDPQSSTVTVGQVSTAPNSFNNFVSAITADINGRACYGGDPGDFNCDFGYPSQMIQRDLMGQDMAFPSQHSGFSWFTVWYNYFDVLTPSYAACQIPWTVYYAWIKNCNLVIKMGAANPSADHKTGVGIAYAMRAFFYEDMAQMYANETYTKNPQAETVPIVTDDESIDMNNNPRATNEKMWDFIISDLDKAEEYLAGYQRPDKTTPDVSVVYGLKARAYLVMGKWDKAEEYAKKAQEGYSVMTAAEYTDRDKGFNTPNEAWMFCVTYKDTDPCIKLNDGDTSWGSQMTLEIDPVNSQCGYAANYGDAKLIDRHLYETMPATDCRKKCFVDFSTNDMEGEELTNKLKEYSDYPSWLIKSASAASWPGTGGLCLKFRAANGAEGHANQHLGFLQSVPLMRVEEMKLIEAEAAGMQDEARGKQLLEAFAKTRDPQYVYGKHVNDKYGNSSNSGFQNEIWWQRRVELWGEGFATLDIKRLNKGVIRSYAGTNHTEGYRWNTTTVPQWMTLMIVESEGAYNAACTQNPMVTTPTSDSEEYAW